MANQVKEEIGWLDNSLSYALGWWSYLLFHFAFSISTIRGFI